MKKIYLLTKFIIIINFVNQYFVLINTVYYFFIENREIIRAAFFFLIYKRKKKINKKKKKNCYIQKVRIYQEKQIFIKKNSKLIFFYLINLLYLITN
jgi:hypothetical protein